MSSPFKACGVCRRVWDGRADFLGDPDVRLLGYQVNLARLGAGVFMFEHGAPGCGTSLGLEVDRFADLHNGPIFETRLTGTPACEGHCLHDSDLDPCGQTCECAFVRDILQRVRAWPKRGEA